MTEQRKNSPSYHRNIEPITVQLHKILKDASGNILEIGSGSGQHAARLTTEFPDLIFQPTDYDDENLESITAWTRENTNTKPARKLDVMSHQWFDSPSPVFEALLCFNVIHISPWEVTEKLFEGAANYIASKGKIILYGPYRINGKQTSESNENFEGWLKSQDERFGVRDIKDVEEVANRHGFYRKGFIEMPANNFIVVFVKQ